MIFNLTKFLELKSFPLIFDFQHHNYNGLLPQEANAKELIY
jgi:hypothetical protein